MRTNRGKKSDPVQTSRESDKDNPSEYVEMFAGPNLEYAWIAEVTREPSTEGLDGGRIQYFNLVKTKDTPQREAPGFDDIEKYEQWLKDVSPNHIQIARYDNGALTIDEDDPHAQAIVEDIKQTCASLEISGRAAQKPTEAEMKAAVSAAANA